MTAFKLVTSSLLGRIDGSPYTFHLKRSPQAYHLSSLRRGYIRVVWVVFHLMLERFAGSYMVNPRIGSPTYQMSRAKDIVWL